MHSVRCSATDVVVYRSVARAVDMLEKTPLGKSIYLIGSNERANFTPALTLVGC